MALSASLPVTGINSQSLTAVGCVHQVFSFRSHVWIFRNKIDLRRIRKKDTKGKHPVSFQ